MKSPLKIAVAATTAGLAVAASLFLLPSGQATQPVTNNAGPEELLPGTMSAVWDQYKRTGDEQPLEAAYRMVERRKEEVLEPRQPASGPYVDKKLLPAPDIPLPSDLPPPSIPDLRTVQKKLLRRDQIALHYYIRKGESFLLAICRHRMTLHKLHASTAGDIIQLRSALKQGVMDDFQVYATTLYRQLIEPAAERLNNHRHLLILPDHDLHYLPFELLLSDNNGAGAPNNWPWLIRDYKISYAPSLTAYQKMKQEKKINSTSMLAVAPYAGDRKKPEGPSSSAGHGSQAKRLPLTFYETRKISDLFRSDWRKRRLFKKPVVTLLWNEEASIGYLDELDLSDFGYIHFATHAWFHEEIPERSGILLYDDGTGRNVLRVDEIGKLDLNAKLLVLSGCETGLGKVTRSGGVKGMGSLFIRSGAMNLLVSLWKVSDRDSAELMVRFYEELLENGVGKAEALRRAKLALLEEPVTSFPASWASFILLGG